MEGLIIGQDRNTPDVNFNPKSGVFEIKGRSFPENSKKFYEPVLSWLDAYLASESKANKVSVHFELFYVSSSSIISILEIIKRLNIMHENGAVVSIEWRYDEDDEDIRKIGEDYKKLTPINFEFAANSGVS